MKKELSILRVKIMELNNIFIFLLKDDALHSEGKILKFRKTHEKKFPTHEGKQSTFRK